MANNTTNFLLEFIRHPVQTGAVAPSSRFLAARMVEWLDLPRAAAVLEYGPGTGAFTPVVLERLRPGCKFLAIERNPSMASRFKSRLPQVPIVEDSVENIRSICDRAGIEMVDCIVCGLPWAAFPEDLQRRLLDAMMSVLRPGGQFVTFAYLHGLPLPAGRRFARKLPAYFSEVTRSATVWPNIPPAFVYRCRR